MLIELLLKEICLGPKIFVWLQFMMRLCLDCRADEVIATDTEDLVSRVKEITGGHMQYCSHIPDSFLLLHFFCSVPLQHACHWHHGMQHGMPRGKGICSMHACMHACLSVSIRHVMLLMMHLACLQTLHLASFDRNSVWH